MEIVNSQQSTAISGDELIYQTDGGRNIYEYYGQPIKKLTHNPWRSDRHKSFSIFKRNNIYFWKDIAKEEKGTAIQFVQKLYNLDYNTAIKKIQNDLNVKSPETKIIIPIIAETVTPLGLKYNIIPFTDKHHDYWLGLSEDFLNKECKIYAINKLYLGRNIKINKDELCFIYIKNNIEAKIYFPHRNKGDRFIGNIQGNYFFYMDMLPDKCNKIFVVKSNKDGAFFKSLGLHVVVARNESVESFSTEIRTILESKVSNKKDIIICYGSDEDGKTKSKKITDLYGYSWFNIPNSYLTKNITDFYEFIEVYNITLFKTLLKKKKLYDTK